MQRILVVVLIPVLLLSYGTKARAETYVATTAKDNTLFEDTGGFISNGAGQYMFAGRTVGGAIRRAVMAFDLSSIPAGSIIESVSLRLHMSRTRAGSVSMRLHRLTSDWGEGASDSGAPGGGGGAAEAGDATWLHTFYDQEFWNAAGGDFLATVSAQTNVGGFGSYTWSGAGMVDDVQAWIDGQATNAGWMLRGPETAASAKRFETREAVLESERPELTITYTPIPEVAPVGSLAAIGLIVLRRLRV